MGTSCSFCSADKQTIDIESKPIVSRPKQHNSNTDNDLAPDLDSNDPLKDQKEDTHKLHQEGAVNDKTDPPTTEVKTQNNKKRQKQIPEEQKNENILKTDPQITELKSEKEQLTSQKEILDTEYDAASEATDIYNWLHGKDNKLEIEPLKNRLAQLLTSRSDSYKQQLIQSYRSQYIKNLEKDIKKVLGKGTAMELIRGLLMTQAQYDAMLISEYVKKRDIEPVADIICCRSMQQLKDIDVAYKAKYKLNVKAQLQALAQTNKKKTLVKTIVSIFEADRKENVDIDGVNEDLNFVLSTKNFKGGNKEKLVLIFSEHSEEYIKVFNEQFMLKSKESLVAFVDRKLGSKSTAGYFCKTRIEYALDIAGYYAVKINNLGKQFKKNEKKICDIFRQRMEIDLDLIQKVWVTKKYGNGKELKEWVLSKTSGLESGLFLCKMLAHRKHSSNTRGETRRCRSRPMSKVMNEEVRVWLEQCEMVEYYQVFIDYGYESLDIVREITAVTELIEIGIDCVEHQTKLLNEISTLQNKFYDTVGNDDDDVIIENENRKSLDKYTDEGDVNDIRNDERVTDEGL